MKKTISLFKFSVLTAFLLLTTEGFPGTKNREWTIVETWQIPGKASGLAFDGQFLYYGIYGQNGDHFYKFDPVTGTATQIFIQPLVGDCFGMTYDGENLWVINQPSSSSQPAQATEMDFSGNILSTITLPDHYMSGIAWDNGNFWVHTYYPNPGKIYKIDASGTVLSQINPPAQQGWDLCLQDENLWVADYDANNLYKIDQTGAIIEQHACEDMKPSGVVYDGQYLWYVDGQLSSGSTLYKIDLGGSGTPAINIPVTSWNYGNVAVGDSAVWNMVISSIGTEDLIIENILIQNAVPVFTWEVFPQTVAPGESTEITLIYKPTESGPLNTIITVLSNDPVNPEIEVQLMGEAVISGPSIHVLIPSHYYGNVRTGATTRWFLLVENIGNENLVINELNLDIPDFYIDENIVLPFSISPLQVAEIGVWFHPVENIYYQDYLEIVNNDPANPSVSVFLEGNGNTTNYPIGTLFWQYTIDAGWDNSPKAIAPIQDISGDGVDDVIVCSEDNFIRCFNGNAHQTGDVLWETEIYSGNVYQQRGLFISADLNEDGIQDVVVGTTGGDVSVRVFCGKTGNPVWQFQTSLWGDGGWVYEVNAAQDYTGDGLVDVLGCAGDDGNDTGPKRAFCIDGADGSLVWNTPLGGPAFGVISIEDVTGDGLPDVLAGASNEFETEGKVACLNGDNGSIIWQKFTDGSSVWGLLQLDDINEDGVKDVAAGDFYGNFYGYDGVNGDELFSGNLGAGLNIINKLVRLDDVNSDGIADFTIASSSDNCVAIDGKYGSNIWLTPLADQASKLDRIKDISGDGINDIVVGTLYSNNYVYFLDGVTGEDMKSVAYGQAVDAMASIPDINQDFSHEMVAGGRDGKVVCYSGGLDAWTEIQEVAPQHPAISVDVTPNPFVSSVQASISSTSEKVCNISIISAGGRLMKDFGTCHLSSEPLTIEWNGLRQNENPASPGLYFLIVTNGNNSLATKLVKLW